MKKFAVVLFALAFVLKETVALVDPPASPADNCDQDATERVQCPSSNNKTRCIEQGCHYCKAKGLKNCIEGIACKRTPTAEDDCRDNATHVLTEYECLLRECSWCKSNSDIKCVRDLPTPSGSDIDNCDRDNNDLFVRRCKARGNETLCMEKGCHYCPDRKPKCIEGWACQIPPTEYNMCTRYIGEVVTPKECLSRNCSWCRDNPVNYRCLTDPATMTEPPPSPVNNCALNATQRVQCPANGDRSRCWDLGCHYCQKKNAPNCIEGIACRKTPTAADDCRDNSTHVLTARECWERGCSYCKSNSEIKCVKDAVEDICPAGENLHCFPFPDADITESQCMTNTSCTYCDSATDLTKKCVIGQCPDGWELRYDGMSCCATSGSESGPRIVGGVPANQGQWPWLVALDLEVDSNSSYLCGGFLVDDTRVISAAHCMRGNTITKITVILGSVNALAGIEKNANVNNVVVHPGYQYPNDEPDDIMIVVMDSPVTFTSNIQPIKLPSGETAPDGTTCYVAGWGSTEFGGGAVLEQREVNIEILPFQTCTDGLSTTSVELNETLQICSGALEGGRDSCQGDSGGPLMCERCKNCDWYAAGIVSFGDQCALPNVPAIYTRVSAYETWLSGFGVVLESETYDCDFY